MTYAKNKLPLLQLICLISMKLYLLAILLSQYLSFIICSCNHQNQCFDQKKQQCKLVDGKEYIGKEKRYGYCVIDAIKYDLIDFCKSDYEPVCISQDRKSCIKVQNSNHIVAILDSENICIGLNEFTSNFNSPQKLKYIKKGFCQDLYGQIKLGQAKQNVSVLFLCNYLEGGQFRRQLYEIEHPVIQWVKINAQIQIKWMELLLLDFVSFKMNCIFTKYIVMKAYAKQKTLKTSTLVQIIRIPTLLQF
ncbi:transmembrane protein, putative (macronuclear) [Tetrahymena thermophila SB210]|uniref:Transmembrane protein, putative n=1 Tax=Tetrahymena thermophila (strain SB210) TaxID=312017 RepID=Q22C08_TETTS|nr:transmembrane protein, putative [Tetrahymena thermophila SB210]EAR82801.3 transmembrane protein, putative [Tetrahymena thermophila SB210]|eukprot:XP_001030464.3 transmembrane protein, putative [Tetrahymena thermophila SB210]